MLTHEVRHSHQRMADLLSNDFIEIASSGRAYNKRQVLDALRNELPARRSLTAFKMTPLADNVVLVTYQAVKHVQGVAESEKSQRCSIWKFVEQRWQIVFHQGTPIT